MFHDPTGEFAQFAQKAMQQLSKIAQSPAVKRAMHYVAQQGRSFADYSARAGRWVADAHVRAGSDLSRGAVRLGNRVSNYFSRGTTSVWSRPALERGRIIEQQLGANLGNFPVIDRFVAGPGNVAQSVTSIKSIDLMARTYQSGNVLFNRIMGYSHKLSNFAGDAWGGHVVNVGASTQRKLEIAIPSGATEAQMQQINRAIREAAEIGVEIVTIIVR